MIKVMDFYVNANQYITIILDLNGTNQSQINIDFIIKFIQQFKKKYENKVFMRKFYVINCPKFIRGIYNLLKGFLHQDTKNKIELIKEKHSLPIEEYYYN